MGKNKLSPEVLAKLSGYGMVEENTVKHMVKIITDVELIKDDNGDVVDEKIQYLDEEFCPTFTMKLPNNKEVKKIRKTVNTMSASGDIDEFKVMEDAVTKAIIGWENFYSLSTGEEIVYEKEKRADISLKILADLFIFITESVGIA